MRIITRLKNFAISIIQFAWTNKKSALDPVTVESYKKDFIEIDPEIRKAAYEKAWAAKNFEIDNYWKRATYVWAFQVAAFAGYFTVLNSTFYLKNSEVLYCVICIGFVTALAWTLINKGSKTWQRNWESHVDMLEDYVTGPLYKTVTAEKTYSVSKINDIVSTFITSIWLILGVKYLAENITFDPVRNAGINWTVLLASFSVTYFSSAMVLGHGRGRFGERKFSFYQVKRP